MTYHSHGGRSRDRVRASIGIWRSFIVAALCLSSVFCGSVRAQAQSAQAHAAATAPRNYHLEKRDSRWSLIDPEGRRIFVRAVSQVDTSDFGGQGNFQSYDAVYLATSDEWSRNLSGAAKNSLRADVVDSQGVTLHE